MLNDFNNDSDILNIKTILVLFAHIINSIWFYGLILFWISWILHNWSYATNWKTMNREYRCWSIFLINCFFLLPLDMVLKFHLPFWRMPQFKTMFSLYMNSVEFLPFKTKQWTEKNRFRMVRCFLSCFQISIHCSLVSNNTILFLVLLKPVAQWKTKHNNKMELNKPKIRRKKDFFHLFIFFYISSVMLWLIFTINL